MSLQGKVIFIAGGTGTVGSGIAVSLLKAGARVWISSRDAEKIREFKKTVPENLRSRLVGVRGDVSDEDEVLQIRDLILTREGKVNHVISSLGGWWQKGKLSNQSLEEYTSVFNNGVIGHFLVFKIFSKELAKHPRSTYTFITGGAGEVGEKDDEIFIPEASLISASSPAVYGIYLAAKSEFDKHPNLKVSQLRIFVYVQNKEDSAFDAEKSTMQVGTDYIGRFVVKIVEKHRGGLLKVKTRKEGDELFNNI